MKNIVIVICSSRHSQFCNFICESIIKAGFLKIDKPNYDFVFVLNDSQNIEDFKSKAKHSEEVYDACLSFIENARKIGKIECNNKYRYEIGSLNYILNENRYRNCEQVFLLQCSYEILDLKMFDILFSEKNKDKILGIKNAFQDYALKIPVKYLRSINIPIVKTKLEAVRNEGNFIVLLKNKYKNLMSSEVLGEIIVSKQDKFGRKNRVEETKYFRKWKGTWGASMIKDAWDT